MTSIEPFFENLAFTTWDAIEAAFDYRIMFGEDAITSVNLLALKNASFSEIVIADTRVQERLKGCDFEFWIGNYSAGWTRYAIQAKKINVSSERYDSLNHTVGGRAQIDILGIYANTNNAVPLYCLYNYSKSKIMPSTACPKFKNIKEFGCSITPLETARHALGTRGARNFNWFHTRKETLPWSCLVRCPDLMKHWPVKVLGMEYESARHRILPRELSEMFDSQGENNSLIDTEIFSGETEYRPRWVGVINTETKVLNSYDLK